MWQKKFKIYAKHSRMEEWFVLYIKIESWITLFRLLFQNLFAGIVLSLNKVLNLVSSFTPECLNASLSKPLPSSVSCQIPNYCTGIDCCAEIGFLGGRSINFQVLLDPCKSILSLSIENMQYNITLMDYKFGTINRFTLQGALRIEYVSLS